MLTRLAPGEEIDFQRLMYSYTFDAICEVAFSHPVDSLGGVEADVRFQRCFDAVQARSMRRISDPVWKAKRAAGVGAERDFARDMRVVDGYIAHILDARAAADAAPDSDLLSMFEAHCEGEGRAPSRRDLRDLVMNFMIAGRDTTASALTWAAWELSRDEGARRRVEDEARRCADPHTMDFTHAVFLEALRLHPSVPLDGKECVAPDVLPDGTRVPRGCTLAFHPCVITRNPGLYPDPDSFLPQRWLDGDGRCTRVDEFRFPVFNAGPRLCLGRHMAALEAKVLLADLAAAVRVSIAPGFTPRLRLSAVLMTRNGMPATVERISGGM